MDSSLSKEYIIDSEQLIASVENMPIIWNNNHHHNKDRAKRRKCWLQICQSLFDDFDSRDSTEQEFISKQIEMRWKHIRDNYRREINYNMKPGKKAKRLRPYIYTQQLEFLRSTIEENVTKHIQNEESHDFEDDNDTSLDDDDEEPVVPKKRSARTKSSRNIEFEETIVPVEFNSRQEYEEQTDDDFAFFRSLTPMLANLTLQQKMKFRIEVMQQLLKYQPT